VAFGIGIQLGCCTAFSKSFGNGEASGTDIPLPSCRYATCFPSFPWERIAYRAVAERRWKVRENSRSATAATSFDVRRLLAKAFGVEHSALGVSRSQIATQPFSTVTSVFTEFAMKHWSCAA
jgi:hypothetical protein